MELKDIIDLSPEGLMTDILDTRQTMLSWEDHIIDLQQDMQEFKKEMLERFDRLIGYVEKQLSETTIQSFQGKDSGIQRSSKNVPF